MSKYAVIDLGTNTFHLIAVELLTDGTRVQLHKERIYVKLAEGGIGTISEAAYQRGLDALTHFKGVIDEHGIGNVVAFGTAALRTASNGADFVEKVKEQIGIHITRISGMEEARLIHKGVQQAIPSQEHRIVIMDIGGGSVEFIIADNEEVIWSQSFPLGVGVLYHGFHHSEPIKDVEVKELKKHLEEVLSPFIAAMEKYNGQTLVGASGTFDVLDVMMEKSFVGLNSSTLEISTFDAIYRDLLGKSYEERLAMPKIPDTRADMIVVALILVQFVLEKTEISEIIVSKYAMKEGILTEMIKK